MEALVDAYSDPAARGVLRMDSSEGDEMLQALLDGFAQVTGVSASLRIIGADDEAELGPAPPAPPVTDPVECQHDASDRYYLHDSATGLWWTRDTAGHAGAVFKTYRLVGGVLRHNADHDAQGVEINKFKGQVGQAVSMGSLHGCAHPRRHL
jgi:hypothetical protein